MAFVSLMLAVFIFLIGALSSVFDWNLREFSPLYWGLTFFSLSFLVPEVRAYRNRQRV